MSNLPSVRQRCDRQFAHHSSAVSFTLGHARSLRSLFLHLQHRHFRLITNTSLSPSSTPFRLQPFPSSSVLLHLLSHMAINTEFTHRRSASAASSVNEAGSDGGTSSGSASTVATARSTPFIGPQNHPGLPPQFHPAPIDPVYGNLNARHGQTTQLEGTAFAFQLDEVETQIRLLDTHDPHSHVTLGSEYE